MNRCKCGQTITATFEEAAFALGGVVASYPIPDEVVWEIARLIDVTHRRIQERLCRYDATPFGTEVSDTPKAHPAIVHLLQKLDTQAHGDDARHDKQ